MITLSVTEMRHAVRGIDGARPILGHIDARVANLRARQPGVSDSEAIPIAVWFEIPTWERGTRCPVLDLPALLVCAGKEGVAVARVWALDCAERVLPRWEQRVGDPRLRRAIESARAHLRGGCVANSTDSWGLLELSRAHAATDLSLYPEAVQAAFLAATCPRFLVQFHTATAASCAIACVSPRMDAEEEAWQRARLLELLA